MKKNLKRHFLYFIFYSVIGGIYETFLEVVIYRWGYSNRGVLFGPYCPVYGFGALAFILIIYKLIKNANLKTKIIMIPVVFLGCMLIATLIELITSYICEAFLGYWRWQTYLNYNINFEGRIALSPSLRFGLGGVIFLYIFQPLFEKFCNLIKERGVNILFYILLIIFSLDVITTIFF